MSKSSILWQANEKNGDIFEDIEARAKDYLLKYLDIEELMADIKVVAMRNAIISQAIAGRLTDFLRSASEQTPAVGTPTLSIRELEVLQLVAGGASNGEIAGQLYISEATVKTHLRNIMDKMQVKNRAQAVAKAISNGVLRHYTPGQQSISYSAKRPDAAITNMR